MKRTGLTLAAVCMLALGIAGCEDGPTGPHPDLELSTRVPRSTSDTTMVEWMLSAKAIMSGDSVVMVGREFVNDTVTDGGIRLFGQYTGTENGASISIAFHTLPTEPGEYPWKTAQVAMGDFGGFSATVTDGAVVNVTAPSSGPTKGGAFYAVSGKTVITKVRRDANGAITGYEGYFNGKLRGVWPDNFVPTQGQFLPPGFDVNNPTLVGRSLTVHSARFITRSASVVTPVRNVQ